MIAARIARLTILAILVAAAGGSISAAAPANRPNILWIVSEDNAATYLRLYHSQGAPTPHIEALARDGVVFNNAFSNAPVCSVARSTLITGSYAPRLGLQFHRGFTPVPLPTDLRMFPAYLRDAGYYTTNNAKEDYNARKDGDVWDDSSVRASYRNRAPGQPFFHVQNLGTTHEGHHFFTAAQMAMEPTKTDPGGVRVPAYLPDTPLFRYAIARYQDLQMKMDKEVGRIVAQLEEDGLIEDTIIFYYGDHGGILPRSKGYAYESGLHPPLVVRAPAKWRHLVAAPPGCREEGFLSLVEFGPTVLHLAGIPVPAAMDGRPFLGAGVGLADLSARRETFGYADRFDEKYDFVRTVRQGNFKYVRSYQPFNVDGLYNQYRYRQLAYQELSRLEKAGELNTVQRQFFAPRTPEALYDLAVDPDETRNLANDPAYAEVTARLRIRLAEWTRSLPDLSFFPESVLLRDGAADPRAYGTSHRTQIARLADIADLALQPWASAAPQLRVALASTEPWERYWALIACSAFGSSAREFEPTARNLAAGDPERLVRARAAEFLGLNRAADPAPVLLGALRESAEVAETLLILNIITLLRDHHGYAISVEPADLSRPFTDITNRLNHLL